MDTPGRSCYRTRRNHANGYRPYNRLPIRPRNCERDKIILEYPTITMRLLNMLIKEKWNELSQEEQNSYKKMAALDRARYEEEMVRYKSLKGQKNRRNSKAKSTCCYLTEDEMEKARKEFKQFLLSMQNNL
ncbi:uncharacterized protein isoform X2 [Rhodnius prolixus]|uniref:uncharacterized protein isoform X2 n=1 Tax=Rhodnius prolixus TaxID=13249 RepID=UPI003D18A958